MALYFCFSDMADRLEKAVNGRDYGGILVPVSLAACACNGFSEDAFLLSSRPDLINLDDESGLPRLSALIDNVPLYRINLELALDRALTERHRNAQIAKALESAFAGNSLPSTFAAGNKDNLEETTGNLNHPMLGHTETAELCAIYVSYQRLLSKDQAAAQFEGDIIGRHPENILISYDGYIIGGKGMVRADTLLGFGMRVDHDHGKPMESYIESGSRKAHIMNPAAPQERIWAWLEADHHQMRRCRDIHRFLMLPGIRRRPNWLRADAFGLLEQESMKQVFAEMIVASDRTMALLDQAPALKKAIMNGAEGIVDERLQALLSQILNAETAYAGSAEKFALAAREREAEAQRMKFI